MQKVGNRYVKQSTNYLYEMTATRDGDNITFAYVGCNAAAQTVLNTFADVDTFVKAITNQTFKIDASKSRFNMSGLKLTNTSDGNTWLEISL